MNRRLTVKLLLGAILLATVLSGAGFAEEASRQPVNPLFKEFSAAESHRFMKNFVLNDALGTGRASIWFSTNAAQVLPTAVVPNRQAARALQLAIMPQIGKVTSTTSLGQMSLDQFLYHPKSSAQAFIVVYKGRIVFEQYPGMTKADAHVLASAAKVTASLLVDVLIEEGKINEQKTMGDYVPEFAGTVWAPIKVIDVLDMTTGLDTVDSPQHFGNPDTVIARMLRAELGEPYKGKVETILDVMKMAKPISESGEYFTYSSTATQALAILAEAVTGQTWADAFDQRIWSKMGVEGPFQVHLSPDGIALAHGLLSMRLRDLARFGMLYTPSWDKIAAEQIVTPEILKRTRVPYRSREFYRAGPSGKAFMERLGDYSVRTGGRQWDAVWDDGDFFKAGLNTQGIYVSPARDLVIAYFSVEATQQIQKYLRPLVTSGLFD